MEDVEDAHNPPRKTVAKIRRSAVSRIARRYRGDGDGGDMNSMAYPYYALCLCMPIAFFMAMHGFGEVIFSHVVNVVMLF